MHPEMRQNIHLHFSALKEGLCNAIFHIPSGKNIERGTNIAIYSSNFQHQLPRLPSFSP